MSHIVQIKPSGYLLFVVDGESVLDAALRQGYEFPYSCGSGTCGTCMGKVLSGTFTYGDAEPYALDQEAMQEHFALFCLAKPTSDMIIEIEDVYGPEYLPVRKAEYLVSHYQELANNIYQIFLTPTAKKIQYHAGQYLKIICETGIPLPFSIANAPQEDGQLELQIKAITDNPYTREIIEKAKNKTALSLRGPYGKVLYRDQPQRPIIFVAGGTGIVPLKAIIEQALKSKDTRSMHLYWSARTPDDIYLYQQMQQLAKQHPNFNFTAMVQQPTTYWQGATGSIEGIITQNYDDLSDYQVYTSGPTEMVYTLFDTCVANGLKPQLIFSDTFEYAPRTI